MALGNGGHNFTKMKAETGQRPAFRCEGVDYSPTGIEEIRVDLIEMRNRLLATTMPEFKSVILLTHTTALLAYLREIELATEEER